VISITPLAKPEISSAPGGGKPPLLPVDCGAS
jgi:hypothetical protein